MKSSKHFCALNKNILLTLSSGRYFSTFDFKIRYWAVVLEELSSYWTMLNTPFGRYQFLRLPSGIVCAGDVFSSCIDKLFGGILGAFSITDDLKVQGEEESIHDIDLLEASEVVKHKGLVFNLDKWFIKPPEVTYFRYVLGKDGVNADSYKLKVLNDLAYLQNQK